MPGMSLIFELPEPGGDWSFREAILGVFILGAVYNVIEWPFRMLWRAVEMVQDLFPAQEVGHELPDLDIEWEDMYRESDTNPHESSSSDSDSE